MADLSFRLRAKASGTNPRLSRLWRIAGSGARYHDGQSSGRKRARINLASLAEFKKAREPPGNLARKKLSDGTRCERASERAKGARAREEPAEAPRGTDASAIKSKSVVKSEDASARVKRSRRRPRTNERTKVCRVCMPRTCVSPCSRGGYSSSANTPRRRRVRPGYASRLTVGAAT